MGEAAAEDRIGEVLILKETLFSLFASETICNIRPVVMVSRSEFVRWTGGWWRNYGRGSFFGDTEWQVQELIRQYDTTWVNNVIHFF